MVKSLLSLFFLNGDGCKAPEFTASIIDVGDTITKRPKRIGKLQPSPENKHRGPRFLS
jgi:hypothetical protein